MITDLNILYDKLFREMYSKLYVYAKRFVDEDDAQDIVEDVFVELWRRRDTVEFGERIKSFLYCSTYTKCLNLLKHHKVSASHIALIGEINEQRLLLMDEVRNTPEHQLECEYLHNQIEQAISELPENVGKSFG